MVFEDLLTGVRFLTSAQIPPELALKVIQSLPFGNGKTLAALRSCNSSLTDLFATYEYSLTNWFMEKELRHAPTDFPYSKSFGLKWLGECVYKYDIVDQVMDEMCCRDNCIAVEVHNQTLVYAGLLLLYQLADIPDYKSKLAFINSLPLDPLTAIYIALHHATLTARYHGFGWINQRTYGRFMDANQMSLRNELEFSFAEASLSIGPEFLHDMLVNPSDPSGETTLLIFYHEHGSRKWDWPCWGDGSGEFKPPRTYGPLKEEGMKDMALFIAMLERMAGLVGCTTDEIRTRIELDTDVKYHQLANLDMYNKARLVSGLDAAVD